MKNLLIFGVAFGALVGPAIAADMPVKAMPKPVAVASWTGCYVGGSFGADWARSNWTYRNINPYSAPGPGGPIALPDNRFDDMSSWIAGGQVGCNYEFQNRWVVGIEGSWSGSKLNEGITNLPMFPPPFIQTVTTDIKSIYTVTGRLGYSFLPNWLGYAKAGFASARIQTSGQTTPAIPGLVLDWNTALWHNGYVVGLGAEYMVTRNITVGVEYNYIGLGSVDHVGAVSGGGIGPANQIVHGVTANIQSVMARANFLFGGGPIVARY